MKNMARYGGWHQQNYWPSAATLQSWYKNYLYQWRARALRADGFERMHANAFNHRRFHYKSRKPMSIDDWFNYWKNNRDKIAYAQFLSPYDKFPKLDVLYNYNIWRFYHDLNEFDYDDETDLFHRLHNQRINDYQ